jgi:SAM-dependent methyltransferase
MDSVTTIPDPPSELSSLVGGVWETGRFHVIELKDHSQLKESDRVLDVGCGVGRTAVWLSRYLTTGGYEGFDINAESIAWCQREISSRFPSFRFTHLDLYNAAYNPHGELRAEDLTFPYPNDQFDLVFLFSVFTHLLLDDAKRYLAEIRRVLKPGGRMHATFFLLDEERLDLFRHSDEQLPRALTEETGPCRAGHAVAEWFVAYEEEFVKGLLDRAGLPVRQIHHGPWHKWALGEEEEMKPQDTVIAYRS